MQGKKIMIIKMIDTPVHTRIDTITWSEAYVPHAASTDSLCKKDVCIMFANVFDHAGIGL